MEYNNYRYKYKHKMHLTVVKELVKTVNNNIRCI
nr:MAG TPA: hypothetical protein [Caudoviricetes sp.]